VNDSVTDVSVVAATTRSFRDAGLPAAAAAPQPATSDDELAPLLDRLGNRLGFAALGRSAPRLSHRPELAVALAPPLAPAAAWPVTAPRPLRLLSRPEPVAADLVDPGMPPAWFDWQGRRRHVARAEGPERIAGEWWRSAADGSGERDYYRLEDADGRRFWLYRETGADRWYLHGLFA